MWEDLQRLQLNRRRRVHPSTPIDQQILLAREDLRALEKAIGLCREALQALLAERWLARDRKKHTAS